MADSTEKKTTKISINWPAFIALILYPIILALLFVTYQNKFSVGLKEIITAVVGYYGANITVGLAFHRYWSHGSYKTHKWVEFIYVLMSAGCLQGPALVWASDHRYHHAYADTEKDPHTPVKYKNKLKGLLWSHMGWMLSKGESKKQHVDRITLSTLGKRRMLRWQMKYYWQVAAFMNIVPPMLFGAAMFKSFSSQALFAGFLFVGIGRAFQQQATFCVNSLCHAVGSKKYADDSSRDIWWMAPFLLGENWHNFHHAFGRDYRNGHKWYHFDVHKWLIWLMSKTNLAWDLVKTSDERIAARMQDIQDKDFKPSLQFIESTAMVLAKIAAEKSNQIELFLQNKTNNIVDINNKIYNDFTWLKDYIANAVSKDKGTKINAIVSKKLANIAENLHKLQCDASKLVSMVQNNSQDISDRIVQKRLQTLNEIKDHVANIVLDLDKYLPKKAI